MRAELLVHFKERAGMTYRGIAQLDLFADMELSSLGCIYRRAYLNRPIKFQDVKNTRTVPLILNELV